MPTHLDRELETLRRELFSLSAAVEEAVQKAVLAVRRRDAAMARAVVEGDHEIDRLEVHVEEECLKALALYQPVAHDLRLVIGVLKVNDELERIGDLAVNVAQRAQHLAGLPAIPIPFDFATMTQRALWMLRGSLNALVERDTSLAREVWDADDEVDAIYRDAQTAVKDALRAGSEHVDALLDLLAVARFIERLADQATNIAKDALYLVEGEIMRHRHAEQAART